MRKVLIPIDGSPRSEKSVDLFKILYKPGEVEVKLLMVREDHAYNTELTAYGMDPTKGLAGLHMQKIAEKISEYNPEVSIIFGHAGEDILKCARMDKTDLIIMTKSTKKGWIESIGSVTTAVVKYAPCMVLIVPE